MASLCRRILPVTRTFCRFATRTCVTVPKLSPLNVTVKKCDAPERRFSSTKPFPQKETVTVHFIMYDGRRLSTKAKVGENLLDVIVDNDIDVDGFGACEGTLACSTCHLQFKPEHFEQIPEKPTDEELDMLDLAYELCDTSRLGCQVVVTKAMDGWEIKVPAGVADAREV